MYALPAQVLTLVVNDEMLSLEDVKCASLCARSWNSAAARRLFVALRLGSSHTHALLRRMRLFAPRHGHRVRRLTLDLSFDAHRGHCGFVDYTTPEAHAALACSLANVLVLLNGVVDVGFAIQRGPLLTAIPTATYAPLIQSLSTLRRWRTLEVNLSGYPDGALHPVVWEVLAGATAAGVSSRLAVASPNGIASYEDPLNWPWIRPETQPDLRSPLPQDGFVPMKFPCSWAVANRNSRRSSLLVAL